MSLATRCPVCQTVFRVVQDQLKVSEGWVRCGRCAKVFNAFEGLFDLEREFPAMRQPTPAQRVLEDLATRNRQPRPSRDEDLDRGHDAPASQPAAAPAAPTRSAAAAPTVAPPVSAPVSAPMSAPLSAPLSAQVPASVTAREPAARAPQAVDVGAPRPPAGVAMPAARAGADSERPAPPVPSPAVAAARADNEIAIRDEPAPVAGDAQDIAAVPEESFDALFRSDGEMAPPDSAADLDINLDSEVQPAALDDAVDSRLLTFVQQAERAERWRRPWVRLAMALTSLALAALLAAQLLVAQRDAAVARWPGLRSWVQALCSPLDCRIEPLRRIDALGVDSSGLTRIDDGPVYRLVLVLRNRADTALLMPSIDITLTDTAGALVARRVLSANDLGTPRTTIAAGQELPLQALLLSAERPLAGYTIEIFYP